MKTTLIAFCLFLVTCLPSFSQNSLLDRFEGMEGITSVYISETMLKMMPSMQVKKGVDVGKFAGRLTGITILSSELEATSKMLKKETAHIPKDKSYEVLMRIIDGETNVHFLIKKRPNNRISELVMLVDEMPEFVIIHMKGDMSMEEIQALTKQMNP